MDKTLIILEMIARILESGHVELALKAIHHIIADLRGKEHAQTIVSPESRIIPEAYRPS